MRKKPPAKIPDKGEPLMIDLARLWTSFTINGMMLPRKVWEGPSRCPDCGVKKGLHQIPCKLEESPCGLHQYCWDCDCPYHKED